MDILKRGDVWAHFSHLCADKKLPQALACYLPLVLQGAFVQAASSLVLCLQGGACGECVACRSWQRAHDDYSHPDLILFGKPDEPPGIELCRKVGGEISLRPVLAACRLAVIYAADKLSLPAANSLLKTAEEPSRAAKIMFVCSSDMLLATLKSRCTPFHFTGLDEVQSKPLPQSEADWLKWLGGDMGNIIADVGAWTDMCVKEGLIEKAARLDRLSGILKKIPLSATMAADLVILTMKEEMDIEHLFGAVR